MTDMNVEGIEADTVDSVVDDSAIANVETEAGDDTAEAEQDTSAEQDGDSDTKPDGEQWPKKAVNALAHQKKQTAKLRERYETLQREVEQMRAVANNTPKFDLPAPDEDKFDNYADYIEARAAWAYEKKAAETNKETAQERVKSLEGQQQEVYAQERHSHVVNKANEIIAKYPDYTAVIEQASKTTYISPEVEAAFYALDDAPLACYNLAKEGKLAALSYMPIEMARAEIVNAQYRNHAPTQQTKPTSAAPQPIGAVKKGVSHNAKPLAKQSWAELKKNLNLK